MGYTAAAQQILIRSSDGIHWSVVQSSDTGLLTTVAYGNGLFVAGGGVRDPQLNSYVPVLRTSPDGIGWTYRALPAQVGVVDSITYVNGSFMLSGEAAGAIYRSSDGISYTATVPSAPLRSVAWNGAGLIVGVGDGGIEWGYASGGNMRPGLSLSYQNITQSLNSVAWYNGRFHAVGDGGVQFVSTNAAFWEPESSNVTEGLWGTAAGPVLVVAGSGSTVLESGDGDSYDVVSAWTSATLNAVAYGKGTFVAAGDNGLVYTSADGADWVQHSTGARRLTGITFANGTFVAVNPDAAVNTTGVYTSSDGATWKGHEVPQAYSSVSHGALKGVLSTAEVFVATGAGGGLGVSADGVAWTPVTTGAQRADLSNSAFGNGVYIAGAQVPGIVRTTDGTSWPIVTAPALPTRPALAFARGTFVATGPSGSLATSPDGLAWTARTSGTTVALGGDWFDGVTFAHGLFVVVGQDGTIITSPDAISWTGRTTERMPQLEGVTGGGTIFVAVGAEGAVLTSR